MEEYPIIKKKLVIVEDNPALSEIYKVRLELIGYEVFIAQDGEIALAIIQREMPDLVLLDLMIPKISGGDVLAQMRASEWGKNIRVYVISNLNEREAPANLRALGIEGYAVKANLTDNDIDKLVDNILTPPEQKAEGDTTLAYNPAVAAPIEQSSPKNVYGLHMIKISKKAVLVFTGMIITIIGYSALMIGLFGATESHTQVLAFIAGLFLIVFVFLMMLRKKERKLSDYNDVVKPPPEI
jgi:CheY-like chemotaxis protein